jgi:hypothetical protein
MASAGIAGRFSHAACREGGALCSTSHTSLPASRSSRAHSAEGGLACQVRPCSRLVSSWERTRHAVRTKRREHEVGWAFCKARLSC